MKSLKKERKMTRAEKLAKVKNQMFHVCQPCEGIFEICLYTGLIFTTVCPNFEQIFPSFAKFFQNNFWLKSLLMVSSLTGLMSLENQQT